MPVVYTNKPIPERAENDFYPTPQGLVKLALEQVSWIHLGRLKVLDIGAGTGVWGDVLRHMYPDKNISLAGVDIDERHTKPDSYNNWLTEDFNDSFFIREYFDVIMGNPPFKNVEKIIRHAFKFLKPRGQMVMILPNGFVFTKGRIKLLHEDFSPEYVVNVANRPDFTGKGSNPNDYLIVKWRGKESKKFWNTKMELFDKDWTID